MRNGNKFEILLGLLDHSMKDIQAKLKGEEEGDQEYLDSEVREKMEKIKTLRNYHMKKYEDAFEKGVSS
jgi:hypothetical protein